MYKTQNEIFTQYDALKDTYKYFLDNLKEKKDFFVGHKFNSITFIGCGSSYSICRSSEISAKLRLEKPVYSFPAGDLMLNFTQYAKLLKNTMLIAPSRSGSTSEVVMSVKKAREELGASCISISAVKGSPLSDISDLNLELPWAFDESVCQTRTVTNLYTASLLLIAIMADDDCLIREIGDAIELGDAYIKKYQDILKGIGENKNWDKVVVLADSELQGIAEEGALAFKEISQIPSNYYHILDVRHGPMVLIDEKTLVIVAVSPFGLTFQKDLVKDIKESGGIVVTVGQEHENLLNSDYHINVPAYKNYGVMGIPFIYVPQAIAFYKAVKKGVNPDLPKGLDPWIKL